MKKNSSLCLLIAWLMMMSVIRAAAAADPPVSPAASQSETGLLNLLDKVPSSSFAGGWLSYVDVAALARNIPGAVYPEETQAFDVFAAQGLEENVMKVYRAVAAGPEHINQMAPAAREFAAASGLDYFRMSRRLELRSVAGGIDSVWLIGPYDRDAARKSLESKGYLLFQQAGSGAEVWGKNGRIDNGHEMKLMSRDPYFPFGGDKGMSWPVLMGDELVVSSPGAAAMEAILSGSEVSLGSSEEVTLAVTHAANVTDGISGALAQFFLLTPGAAGLDALDPLPSVPLDNGGVAVPAREAPLDRVLPPYSLITFSHVFQEDAQFVIVGLTFAEEMSAAAGRAALESRYPLAAPRAQPAPGKKFLKDMIGDMGGESAPLHIEKSGSGAAVLLMPFRFPLQPIVAGNAGASGSDSPFGLFIHLLMTRDLDWLTAGTAPSF